MTEIKLNFELTIHEPTTIGRYVRFGDHKFKIRHNLNHFQQNSLPVCAINLLKKHSVKHRFDIYNE